MIQNRRGRPKTALSTIIPGRVKYGAYQGAFLARAFLVSTIKRLPRIMAARRVQQRITKFLNNSMAHDPSIGRQICLSVPPAWPIERFSDWSVKKGGAADFSSKLLKKIALVVQIDTC